MEQDKVANKQRYAQRFLRADTHGSHIGKFLCVLT